MTEGELNHLLNVWVQKWAGDEVYVPGLQHPRDERCDSYQGSIDDADAIAAHHGAPELWSDQPPTAETPFHDKTYLANWDESGATEVWVRGFLFDTEVPCSAWSRGLSIAGDIFLAKPNEPAPDERQGEGWDFNEIEEG